VTEDRPPVLILLGPPGAGKSTVSEQLTMRLPLTVIATGKRLRTEIAARTSIGLQIGSLLADGHFAPDSMMDRLMREWLSQAPAEHLILLDGFPRSRVQALALEGMLADVQRRLALVIALEISTDEAIRRLGGRRVCEGGGEAFTLHVDDVAAMRRCWQRGGTLVQRADDQPEVIAERLQVYDAETFPLMEFYTTHGLLRRVSAHGSPAEVVERVLDLVGTVYNVR
jgi:adenylate kinase